MVKVSVIIPCKGRLEHLKKSLLKVVAQSYANIEIIVVDYACPQNTAGWIKSYNSLFDNAYVNCVVADVDPKEWSLSAARNLGFKHSSGDAILFLDADAILCDQFFIEKNLSYMVEGSFICGWGWHDATGCMMIHRSAFEAIKGYNEELKAWGYEDIDIYNRLETVLAHEKRIWMGGIETIKHGDELRNMFHGNMHPLQTNGQNAEIAKIKFKGL